MLCKNEWSDTVTEGMGMMKQLLVVGICVLCLAIAGTSAQALPIADSIADFSDTQGQDGWFYGLYNQGPGGAHGYDGTQFTQLDDFDIGANRWEASDGLVGANNNDVLSLNGQGGHPTGIGLGQDSVIWAVRRYVSEVTGLIDIAFDLRKENTVEPRGGGITGRIFVDGIEVVTQFIANDDGAGLQAIITQNVSIGSTIDFAIDPTGVQPTTGSDGPFSARADGSIFSAEISTSAVPEPSTMLLFSTGMLGLIGYARRRKNSHA